MTYLDSLEDTGRAVIAAAEDLLDRTPLELRDQPHYLELDDAIAAYRTAAASAPSEDYAGTMRALAVIAGVTILAGPRRTRPLAGFAYGLLLSRAAGAANHRLYGVVGRLFDERQALGPRIDDLEAAIAGDPGGQALARIRRRR